MTNKDIYLYRLTHIENIPHILEHGITHIDSPNSNPEYKCIGDICLISTRNHTTVSIDNGVYDPDDDNERITLGDFIPFYFGIRMPMLYVIQNGGNFVVKATTPKNIVYLVCSLQKIIADCDTYYFTDGHATDRLTSYYDSTHLESLIDIIDWSAIKESYWGGPENLNLKRKKQAEFLAQGDIAHDCIFKYLCYNDEAKEELLSFGIAEDEIRVWPNAYY